MKICYLSVVAVFFLFSFAAKADYYLDSSKMTAGAKAGENLVITTGCLDPAQTTCTPRYKWLTSESPIKIGNVTVSGQLEGDVEIVVSGDFKEGQPKTIKLITADNKAISFNLGGIIGFYTAGLGTGGRGWYSYEISTWRSGDQFNELRIQVQQGVAQAIINGAPLDAIITFDAKTVFTRAVLEGITTDDRLTEVKVRGIKGGASVGAINTFVKTIATADLDQDKMTDLAILSRTLAGEPYIQIRNGSSGAMITIISLGTSDYQPLDLSLSDDLDADGVKDFASLLYHAPTGKTYLKIVSSVSKKTLLLKAF